MGSVKQNRFNPDALCLSERRIIDLWDAGTSIERIARATGYQRETCGWYRRDHRVQDGVARCPYHYRRQKDGTWAGFVAEVST